MLGRSESTRPKTVGAVILMACSVLLGTLALHVPSADGQAAATLVMLTPVVEREPGQWAYLHVQALSATGQPVSGVALDWDLRGSVDNNYQHRTTFSTPPTGPDGMASIAYTWHGGLASEDIINVHPPGSIDNHPTKEAVAQVSFRSGATAAAPVWPAGNHVKLDNYSEQPLQTGSTANFKALVYDGNNQPSNNVPVTFQVWGVNGAAPTRTVYTNISGQAEFSYAGGAQGIDVVTASAPSAALGATEQVWGNGLINPVGTAEAILATTELKVEFDHAYYSVGLPPYHGYHGFTVLNAEDQPVRNSGLRWTARVVGANGPKTFSGDLDANGRAVFDYTATNAGLDDLIVTVGTATGTAARGYGLSDPVAVVTEEPPPNGVPIGVGDIQISGCEEVELLIFDWADPPRIASQSMNQALVGAGPWLTVPATSFSITQVDGSEATAVFPSQESPVAAVQLEELDQDHWAATYIYGCPDVIVSEDERANLVGTSLLGPGR